MSQKVNIEKFKQDVSFYSAPYTGARSIAGYFEPGARQWD